MDSMRCDLCKIPLPTEGIKQQHLKGKRHLNNEKIENDKMELIQRSIFVSNIPAGKINEDELVEIFTETYGSIASITMPGTTCAIIEFEETTSANAARQSQRIRISNQFTVEIKPRELRDASQENEDLARRLQAKFEKLENTVLSSLDLAESFEEEAMRTVQGLQLSTLSIKQRESVVEKLNASLVPFFPNFTIVPFGSSVNLFGMEGSDLDISFNIILQESSSRAFAALKRSRNFLLTAQMTELSGENRINEEEWKSLMPPDRARFLTRLLNHIRKTNHLPISMLRVVSAKRCPLVRLVWEKDLICDLSMSNHSGIANSNWLQTAAQADSRIVPMSILIRFWAKVHGITGNDPQDLNSYSVTLLLISYLQKITSADGMNGNDAKDVKALLLGFFTYYSRFKFKETIICPGQGNEIQIEEFKKAPADSSYNPEFKFALMNIQDMNDLAHNTAAKVSRKNYQKFKEALLRAHVLLSKKKTTLKDLYSLVVTPNQANKTSSDDGLENETSKVLSVTNDGRAQVRASIKHVLCDVLNFCQDDEIDEPSAKRQRMDFCGGEFSVTWKSWEGRRNKRREVARNRPDIAQQDILELEVTNLLKTTSIHSREPLLRISIEFEEIDADKDRVSINRIEGLDLDFKNFTHFFFPFYEKLMKSDARNMLSNP